MSEFSPEVVVIGPSGTPPEVTEYLASRVPEVLQVAVCTRCKTQKTRVLKSGGWAWTCTCCEFAPAKGETFNECRCGEK